MPTPAPAGPLGYVMPHALQTGVRKSTCPQTAQNLVSLYSAFRSRRIEHNLDLADGLLLEVIDFDRDDARETGAVRAELATRGTPIPIGPFDVLMAGQARGQRADAGHRECQRVPAGGQFERGRLERLNQGHSRVRPVGGALSCLLLFLMDRRHYPTRKLRLGDPEGDDGLRGHSASERVMMVWQLTLQAWAFKEDLRDEPRLRRDVGRVVRRGG
jgi:hypothetical protein